MRENRTTVIQHFLVLMVLFPLTFWALQNTVNATLSAFSWDDSASAWLNNLLKVEHRNFDDGFWGRSLASGSHRWLVDILTLFPSIWCTRFLTGAVEEIRYTYNVSAVYMLEILGRWIALSAATLVVAPLVGVLFFHAVRFVLWDPLALISTVSLTGFLFFWSWQYPNRRVRHVETVYHFKTVKEV